MRLGISSPTCGVPASHTLSPKLSVAASPVKKNLSMSWSYSTFRSKVVFPSLPKPKFTALAKPRICPSSCRTMLYRSCLPDTAPEMSNEKPDILSELMLMTPSNSSPFGSPSPSISPMMPDRKTETPSSVVYWKKYWLDSADASTADPPMPSLSRNRSSISMFAAPSRNRPHSAAAAMTSCSMLSCRSANTPSGSSKVTEKVTPPAAGIGRAAMSCGSTRKILSGGR